MLRPERKGVTEIGGQIGGALAGDAVDEVERDVVESGITQMMHCVPDVVRTGNTLEHPEELGPERLGAERHTRDACGLQRPGELRRHRLWIRLDRHLVRRR